ncbi:MAG: site-specific integrase [Alphaproteobacteria bacterium]
MPERQKLTLDKVRGFTAAAGKDQFYWDSEIVGFGVRVKPSGVKSFLVQYRVGTRTRRYTIGQFGRVTVEEARKQARILFGRIAQGEDPSADRQTQRAAKTVSEMCDAYLGAARAGKVLVRGKPKKAGTLDIDEGRIERHIKPLLGKNAVNDVTAKDARKFLSDVMDGKTAGAFKTRKARGLARVTGGPGTAGKALALLSTIYNWAMKEEIADRNPCAGIEKPADKKRRRWLSPDEYKALGAALETFKDRYPVPVAAIWALALTGCRRNEILSLRPNDVSAASRGLDLSDTKTGDQLRPAGTTALRYIETLNLPGSVEWVFPASRGEGRLINLRKPMEEICKSAKLEGVTPHVLRHSFATVANELGYSELTIAGLLGHRAGSVTAGYAHHVDSALAAAADRVSATIFGRMKGNIVSTVVEFGGAV